MTDATTTPTDKAGEPVLLPCPFCGGEAWLNDYEAKHSDLPPQSRAPQCRSCGVSLGYLPTAKKAIAAWNTRAHPQPSLSVGLDREAVARVIAETFTNTCGRWCERESTEADHQHDCLSAAEAILALAAPAEGYVLVPVLPTPNMIEAGQDPWLNKGRRQGWATVQAIYRAMIAACLPAAPTGASKS